MGFKIEHTAIPKEQQLEKTDALAGLLKKEIRFFGSSFSNKKKENFYTELSVLLKAGVNLREALSLLAENQKKEQQRLFYKALVDDLVAGKSFSNILETKKEFSDYEYHSLRIGEETGTMPKITQDLGLFYTRKNEQRRNLVNALTYPIIILTTAVFVVIFMLRLVVPMFQDIFKQNNVDLPGITKFIIAASDFIKDYGWWVLGCLFLIIVLRKQLSKQQWVQKKRDYLLLKIPYLGAFIKSVYLAQFTQAISLLTSAKVPMLNSIELVEKMINFHPLKDALNTVSQNILKGKGLSNSLKGNKVFDHKMITLVKVAEETNQTEFIFERLNQQYNIEVQQKSKLLSTLLEPLIILIVGALVGIILVAMYLPMFKLGSVLG